MTYLIKKLGNPRKTLEITELYIDEDYTQEWGLKTTQDGTRHYWRVRGDVYVVSTKDEARSKHTQFRVNLNADEAIKGVDNKIALKTALKTFVAALTEGKVVYEIKANGTWNNNGEKIEYDGWIEFKIGAKRKQVSLLNGDYLS